MRLGTLFLILVVSETVLTAVTSKKYTIVYAPLNFKLTTQKSSLLPFILLPFSAVQLFKLYFLGRLIFRRRRFPFGRRRREEPPPPAMATAMLPQLPLFAGGSPSQHKMHRFGLAETVATGLPALGDVTECFLRLLCILDATRINTVSVDIDRSYAMKVFKAIIDNPDSNVKFQFAHQLFDTPPQDAEVNKKIATCRMRYQRCQASVNEMLDFYALRYGSQMVATPPIIANTIK